MHNQKERGRERRSNKKERKAKRREEKYSKKENREKEVGGVKCVEKGITGLEGKKRNDSGNI